MLPSLILYIGYCCPQVIYIGHPEVEARGIAIAEI